MNRKRVVVVTTTYNEMGMIINTKAEELDLSAQPTHANTSNALKSLDCIDRQAAIDALADYIHNVDKVMGTGKLSEYDCKDAARSVLEDLPSTQTEQRWIPVSERSPDDLEEVNVTWVNHEPKPYYDFVKDKPFTASAVYYKGDWYWYSSVCVDVLAEHGENKIDKIDNAIEITAWMPLPEPYGGEVDG